MDPRGLLIKYDPVEDAHPVGGLARGGAQILGGVMEALVPAPEPGAALAVTLIDGRTYRGTPLAIVTEMRARSMSCESPDFAEYLAFMVETTKSWPGGSIKPTGAIDEDLAASLLAELLRIGLASRREEDGAPAGGRPPPLVGAFAR